MVPFPALRARLLSSLIILCLEVHVIAATGVTCGIHCEVAPDPKFFFLPCAECPKWLDLLWPLKTLTKSVPKSRFPLVLGYPVYVLRPL